MGIGINHALWIKMMKKKYNLNFDNIVMLGRQRINIRPNTNKWEGNFKLDEIVQDDGYSENFFRALADKKEVKVNSIDASDYEKANIIMDLNIPISDDFYGKFNVIIDSGTLEHIFNVPIALHNCMRMCALGGALMFLTPANNWCGHGIYQFSPELFLSILTAQNGFEILDFTLIEENELRKCKTWKLEKHYGRQEIYSNQPLSMFILAKRIGEIPDHLKMQQSDYLVMWKKNKREGRKEFELKILKILNTNDYLYSIRLKVAKIKMKFLENLRRKYYDL